MGELKAFKGRPPAELDDPCDWCHTHYPCHEKKFNRVNCPRVESLVFLDGDQIHIDGWEVKSVAFRSALALEAEMEEEDDDEQDGAGDGDGQEGEAVDAG